MIHKPYKILIIQTAFIGDVILATSLVEKFKQHYPESLIDFLVRKGNEGLLNNNRHLHRVIVLEKHKRKYRNLLKTLMVIRKQHYDIVVNVQRFFSTGFLTAFSRGRIKIGFDKNPWSRFFTKKAKHKIGTDSDIHEIERNQHLIAEFTDPEPAKPRLYPGEKEEMNTAAYKTGDYICIAPASIWFTKQFPASKWIAFINKLDPAMQIYLIGGPEDGPLCQEIKEKVNHNGVNILAGKLNLLESAALMKGSLMNYVNDSAPLHLASGVNAPVCAIFCSTVPAFGFGPLSDRSYIIETKEDLECKPCGLHGFKACPLGHFRCSEIKIDRLLEVLNDG